jgi:hypothetical protein
MIDDKPLALEADGHPLDETGGVNWSRNGQAVGFGGHDAGMVVRGVRDGGNLGRRPETVTPAESVGSGVGMSDQYIVGELRE